MVFCPVSEPHGEKFRPDYLAERLQIEFLRLLVCFAGRSLLSHAVKFDHTLENSYQRIIPVKIAKIILRIKINLSHLMDLFIFSSFFPIPFPIPKIVV